MYEWHLWQETLWYLASFLLFMGIAAWTPSAIKWVATGGFMRKGFWLTMLVIVNTIFTGMQLYAFVKIFGGWSLVGAVLACAITNGIFWYIALDHSFTKGDLPWSSNLD